MISAIELYRAIRERLEETFPNITVQQKDIKNIIHPSFYIKYVGKNLDKQAQTIYEDRIPFNIVYFPEKEALLELLEIEEAFIRAFNAPLIIQDDTKVIEIEKDALQSNLNEEDYFLSITLDFVLMQTMSDEKPIEELDENEIMSEIEITTIKEE